MNFEKILETIEKALESNLETIVLMLIVVTSLYGINILFGTILGTFKEKFIPKKFIFGVFKCIVADIGIFMFCYTLNLFALTLKSTNNITISGEFITTLEVFTVLVVWGADLSKDIIEKIKLMRELKYIHYEDVVIQQNAQEEKGIG